MVNQNRLVDTFLNLVQVDSETMFEQQISKVLWAKFTALGLTALEDGSAARTGHQSGNLLFTLEATAGMEHVPTFFFTCHMDTVAPGIGIKPRVEDDGFIRSDGTTILGADDKAGIATMLEAIQLLQESGAAHGRILFVITAGEEKGLLGSRFMDEGFVKAEFGYALDSNGTIGSIAVAAPGQYKLTMTFHGKSAHAGVNPEDGISAITVAAKAVSRMKLGRIDPETTANIGSFSGSGETNVVCDTAVLRGEARSIDAEKLERQVEAMYEACNSVAHEMGAQFVFEREKIYPAYVHGDDSLVVSLAKRAIENIGATPYTFPSGGGSDANVFNGMGIPTVNLAVGYNQIHTVNENIAIADLVRTAEMVLAIIEEVAKP